ncbi:MAG: 3-isopropylmalate dehydrogenase [Patescibacteria group bacterium]|nr:3-isopropylmalate dehydrogenase [Patescibacteria group bacterium]
MKKQIALVTGDGSGPEMMAQATRIAAKAALLDGVEIKWIDAPMGWNAFQRFGDTTPPDSMEKVLKIGLVFFGGVGDPALDATVGKERPEMMPEPRALLGIRKRLGLLLNFRPMTLMRALAHLSPLKPELIPEGGVEMVFIRFLLEDSYFGTQDLRDCLTDAWNIGLKLKKEVTGSEELVAELAYYRGGTVRKYFRAAFEYARSRKLPLISVDKANVMARYAFWRKIVQEIAGEFPDVPVRHQLVDSACMQLFHPHLLRGVIACGNEHGDILSDGAAEMVGGMGLMHSSAVNPDTGQAMFESGAGTAPTLAGQDKANPLGRILTGAMMLRHIGAEKGATAIEAAVHRILADNYRTGDIAEPGCGKVLTCSGMGEKVLDCIS